MLMPGFVALSVAGMLADNGDDGGGEAKKAGPIALVVILVLAIACYFLFRSMTRHLRKVREDFPGGDPAPSAPQSPADEPTEQPGPPAIQGNGTAEKPPAPGP